MPLVIPETAQEPLLILCLVFQEYCCLYSGVGSVLNYGPAARRFILQDKNKELVLSKVISRFIHTFDYMGNYHFVLRHFYSARNSSD